MITLHWLLEGQVIFIEAVGQLTRADILDMDRQFMTMLEDHGERSVHVFCDYSEVIVIPSAFLVTQLEIVESKKLKTTVVYGIRNAVIYHIIRSVSRFANVDLIVENTANEAAQKFHQLRPSIPDVCQALPKCEPA